MKKKRAKPVKKIKNIKKVKSRKFALVKHAQKKPIHQVRGKFVQHIHNKIIKNIRAKKMEKVKEIFSQAASSVSAELEKKIRLDNNFRKPKIRIIGIGGGAGSIIAEIIFKVKWADFVVANTDARALSSVSRKAKKFQFGQELTKGLGTGMNPAIGELASQNEKEKIKKIFEGQDLCIILACLGGGTSSGAAPVFAKISRDCGCLTIGIFSLPFEFEGEKKMEIAKQALEKIKPCLNAYSVIPNERIFKIIEKNAPLKTALSAINSKLSENIEGLIGMIHSPGLINIDFADLRAVLAGRGRLAYLNMAEIGKIGENIAQENGAPEENSAEKIISDSLYSYNIKGAKGILYNIIGGKDLRLAEVAQMSEMIFKSINKNAKIIFGINQCQKEKGKVKIAILAVGCGLKNVLPALLPETQTSPQEKSILKNMAVKAVSFRKKMSLKKRAVFADNRPGKQQEDRKFSAEERREKGLLPENRGQILREKEKLIQITSRGIIDGKVRRNALQLKKEADEEQKEIMDQEMILETPAILRKK